MLGNIDIPPPGKDQFFWTDFVELRAIIHPDRCFSRGDLHGVSSRCKDSDRRFNAEERWRDIINFSHNRLSAFHDSYPFSISEDKDTITLNDTISSKQHIYIGLLIAASMRLILKSRRNEVARAFEETCLQVFSRLMPEGSEIRATWASGGAAAPYSGSLYNKMMAIANDIRCRPNFSERDFKKGDSGDGGIDIIAWHPMADDRAGLPLAFAQCGCSKEDWTFKQLEATPAKLRRQLPVLHPWSTYYFMPLDLRLSDGGWAMESDIGEAIIVDRLRLLRLASQYSVFSTLPKMPFVEEVRAISIS